ncbi:hypothetical protein ARMSODRAFT_777510 [Armillaria solidipes]|uniref:Uncharacterized protein n=1 Tax=Armillaria solidipes TaxID=1076256 RepID=A0A2H3AS53_9AGAR|nr:hypothetical protein ARMSODRAFT_777510 [Armillaria solidipes]
MPVKPQIPIIPVTSALREKPLQSNDTGVPIDVDTLSDDSGKMVVRYSKKAFMCSGYAPTLPPGSSPHLDYPTALHYHLNLPWDYSIKNGALILHSRECLRRVQESGLSCRYCRKLQSEEVLEGIMDRMKDGTHENTTFAYLGHRQLTDRLHRKDRQINSLKLKGLNDTRLLHGRAAALDDHKRLIIAMKSGKVENLDRLIRIGLKRGLGPRGLLKLYEDAANGVYHPRSYEERDYLRAILFWRVGGVRAEEIAHRAYGLPGITTARDHSTMPAIVPSHSVPRVGEVESNIDSVLPLGDLFDASEQPPSVRHQVLMFDEIATEKRLRYDDKTNCFLGVCREHGHCRSLEFNSMDDLEQVYKAIDEGQVHYASEATVGALGVLDANTRLYHARPILISGTCKREKGPEQAQVIKTVLTALANKKPAIRLRIVSIASDGETKRGSSLILLTLQRELAANSPIYPLLRPLSFMNLLVGDDDITCDKDYRHVFKRIRNLLLRPRGLTILNTHITPIMIQAHLRTAGHSEDHIRALFKPEDKQDVPLTYALLRDIWSLPEDTTSAKPGFSAARKSIRILGKLFRYLLFPYICVDLSLSEQLKYLSAAAHLCLVLFRDGQTGFFPSLLFMDIGIMIKNAFFCVAKAKVDDPSGKFWIILLGTDRLEQLFGILRSIVGNDANLDILQLVIRLTGTTEVANILAKHPEWDRTPRRLRLPAITRDEVEVSDSKVDHINPASWRGDVRLSMVSLITCWEVGRSMVETEIPELKDKLRMLRQTSELETIDILRPFGELLIGQKLSADDDEDDEDDTEPLVSRVNDSLPSSEDSGLCAFEDAAAEEISEITPSTSRTFDKKITMDNKMINKSRALAIFSRYRKHASSTDRLKRVQQVSRYTSGQGTDIIDHSHAFGGPCLMINEPIGTLLYCERQLFLCLGTVTDIRLGSHKNSSVEEISLETLGEDGVTVSFQVMHIVPATVDDDSSERNDWRSRSNPATPNCFTVPGPI